MFQHRESRTQKVEQIFKGNTTFMDEDIEGIVGRLGKVLLRENRIWWETVALEKYLAEEIIPRGLRIKKVCSFDAKSVEFTKNWYRILDQCSFSLMELILKERRRELREMEGELEELKTLTAPCKELSDYKEMEEQVKYNLQKREKEIVDRKFKKFKRDMIDFKTGTQYVVSKKERKKKQGKDNLEVSAVASSSSEERESKGEDSIIEELEEEVREYERTRDNFGLTYNEEKSKVGRKREFKEKEYIQERRERKNNINNKEERYKGTRKTQQRRENDYIRGSRSTPEHRKEGFKHNRGISGGRTPRGRYTPEKERTYNSKYNYHYDRTFDQNEYRERHYAPRIREYDRRYEEGNYERRYGPEEGKNYASREQLRRREYTPEGYEYNRKEGTSIRDRWTKPQEKHKDIYGDYNRNGKIPRREDTNTYNGKNNNKKLHFLG